jgi:hypothetical protein
LSNDPLPTVTPYCQNGRKNDSLINDLANLYNVSSYQPNLLCPPYHNIPSTIDEFLENAFSQAVEFKLSMFDLIDIDAKIYGIRVHSMIDTGASCVFINSNVVLRLKNDGFALKTQNLLNPLKIKLGNSQFQESTECVMFQLTIQGSDYKTIAFVIENLSYDLIIGGSFLKTYRATICYDSGAIRFDSDCDSPDMQLPNPTLNLCQDLVLPPLSEALVNVQPSTNFRGSAFVETNGYLVNLTSVYAGRGIIDYQGEPVQIVVCNLSLQSQVLPAGTSAARLERFVEVEWMSMEPTGTKDLTN